MQENFKLPFKVLKIKKKKKRLFTIQLFTKSHEWNHTKSENRSVSQHKTLSPYFSKNFSFRVVSVFLFQEKNKSETE